MSIEVKVPTLPESVADATVVTWHKNVGDTVRRDENLVDLETDKVVLEVPAPKDGVLKQISKDTGSTVVADELLAVLEEGGNGAAAAPSAAPAAAAKAEPASSDDGNMSPSVRRLVAEKGIDASQLTGTGKNGRITRDDVMSYVKQQSGGSAPAAAATAAITPVAAPGERPEQRVPMSRMRARIAERLLAAKQQTAMLTTFNEINMQPVMELRKRYKDSFEKTHGTKLGFMSFFVKAAVEALKRFPAVNASIDGTDVLYHGYYDIGVAVSTEKGLVVPVVRDADQMSMADIEKTILDFAGRARDSKLAIEEMTGGTFTITNGGVFGSLMATPIINPPQTAILGMHKIQERAVVVDGQVVARPMMYVALSYDHRLIDGKDSVQFLVTIKDMLEDPARLLLEL